MRRKEFAVAIDQQEEVTAFLNEMTFGFLGSIDKEGFPNVTPLNFVYYEDNIYFHGTKAGEKMKSIAKQPQVSFSVAQEFALIPSYMSDPIFACPATSFFKSVLIRGQAVVVQDLAEKCNVFTAFMEKLQPEGGYAPIDPTDEGYAKQVGAVAVVKIEVQEMTSKFKFGQNWSENKLSSVGDQLLERGNPLDPETVRLMNLYCPHHKQQ